MSAQTSYSETPAHGFVGMIAEPYGLKQVDSGLVETAAGIGLGKALKAGTAAGQFDLCAADDAVLGLSVFDGSKETPADGTFLYAQKDQLPVLTKGRCWATANAAVAIDAAVAFDPATGKVGAVSGGVTTLAFGKAVTASAADGDLIVVEVSF